MSPTKEHRDRSGHPIKEEKLKVLMELRPCFEGFRGIAQECRLMFRSLNTVDSIEVTGMINHANRQLRPAIRRNIFGNLPPQHIAINRLSRFAISVRSDPMENFLGKVWRYAENSLEVQSTRLKRFFGQPIRLYRFDATEFGDFIWQLLFSKSIPARDFELIRAARYATIRPSWEALYWVAIGRMHGLTKGGRLPRLSTGEYDIFVSQMPWPTFVSPKTQLVVRYHDAVPVFLPHTVGNARFHQAAHMAGLSGCRQQGALFACNSQATRDDLLRIYPEFEKRSVVIPDMVSSEYFEDHASSSYVRNVIRHHICPETEPKFLTLREREHFYHKYLFSPPLRFLLMVSTIEPRKNHAKLISAWEYLRNHGMADLKLVLVGSLEWGNARIVELMLPAQQNGHLFHLHRVPPAQMRVLYRYAAAVVCPSVAEGFDLSGIEAMLCGGAVTASDIPVHREIYGDACEYFHRYSTTDLAKALERLIGVEAAECRKKLVQNGLRHATRYRTENIMPLWENFFERIRVGEFKHSYHRGLTFRAGHGLFPRRNAVNANETAAP